MSKNKESNTETKNQIDQEIKVEKNIPIPKIRNKYPFYKMEVGDSFLIPEGLEIRKIQACAYAYQKRHNMKFCFREGRCWRIK